MKVNSLGGMLMAMAVVAGPSSAVSLLAYDGNIVLIRPLTTGGKDSSPVLSPDSQTGYFLRAIPDPKLQSSGTAMRPKS